LEQEIAVTDRKLEYAEARFRTLTWTSAWT
jgi:hypothetical protein